MFDYIIVDAGSVLVDRVAADRRKASSDALFAEFAGVIEVVSAVVEISKAAP